MINRVLSSISTAGVLPSRVRRRKLSLAAKENESSEDAYERRLKESQKVEERVEVIFNEEEFRKALDEVRASMHAWSLAACSQSSNYPPQCFNTHNQASRAMLHKNKYRFDYSSFSQL